MKIGSNNYNDQNVYNSSNINSNNSGSETALNKVKFNNMLAELLANTTDEENDTTVDTLSVSTTNSISFFPGAGMFTPPAPPPPPSEGKQVDLTELIEQAVASGKITA